ncbi:hypothetical protein ACTXT7_007407 [Hymenolepis weldensis]
MTCHDGRKSSEVNERHFAKDLLVRGQFMPIKTAQEFNSSKRTLKEIESPKRTGVSLVFPLRKNFLQDEKVNPRMMGGYVGADLTEVPTVMHADEIFSNSVNADADAYAETLQTIVVKPPWIDSLANGERPYAFQIDSAPSH